MPALSHHAHTRLPHAPGRRASWSARLSRSVPGIATRRVVVNMMEGKMLVEFEAADRDDLEAWLSSEGVHYDWLLRVELELRNGKLEPVS